jgi:hypothetical protein
MLPILEATLLTDGSSDRMLAPLVEAVLEIYCPRPFVVRHALGVPAGELRPRVMAALERYPCELLFVHRDAEAQTVEQREREVASALEHIPRAAGLLRVLIVPVRMTEAWLLVDESAIRAAAGNPNGQVRLNLPTPNRVESVDAKDVLKTALEAATELGARRRRRFDFAVARQRVADCLSDYALLRKLPSFRHFEEQVRSLFAQSA